MKSFNEWIKIREDKEAKGIKTHDDDVDWAGNKQKRDVRLSNTVFKPKQQPQVKQ